MAQLSSTFLTHETPGTQGEHTRFSKGLEPRCRHSVSNDAAKTITWRMIASTDELPTKLAVLISFPVESENLSASIGPFKRVALVLC